MVQLASIYLAADYPTLFSSLILVEAVMAAEHVVRHRHAHRKVEAACLARRWQWKSK